MWGPHFITMLKVTKDVRSETTPFCTTNSRFSLHLQTHHKGLPGMWLLCIFQFLVHPLSGCDSISYIYTHTHTHTHPVWRNGPRCEHHSRGMVWATQSSLLFSLCPALTAHVLSEFGTAQVSNTLCIVTNFSSSIQSAETILGYTFWAAVLSVGKYWSLSFVRNNEWSHYFLCRLYFKVAYCWFI